MNRFKAFGLALLALIIFSATIPKIEFMIKSLLNNKVELKVPKDFVIMSQQMMKTKYPSDKRPALVFTNESGEIIVAISLIQNNANQDNISDYKDNFVQNFRKMYPSAVWKDNGVKVINGKKVGFLAVVTPAIDTKVYNLIFFADLDGKLLLCTINCTIKKIDQWTPIANEIMNSLKIK